MKAKIIAENKMTKVKKELRKFIQPIAFFITICLILYFFAFGGLFMLGYSFLSLDTTEIAWIIFINVLNFFLWLLVLLLSSKFAGMAKFRRFLKRITFIIALCLPLLAIYPAIILVKDHEWHINEKTDTSVSDSLYLVNLLKKIGYSNVPLKKVAKFSSINDEDRITGLFLVARSLGGYEDYSHIYLFNKTTIFQDICFFSELKDLRIDGHSLGSLGQIPSEISNLKELEHFTVSSSDIYEIPYGLFEMKKLKHSNISIYNYNTREYISPDLENKKLTITIDNPKKINIIPILPFPRFTMKVNR